MDDKKDDITVKSDGSINEDASNAGTKINVISDDAAPTTAEDNQPVVDKIAPPDTEVSVEDSAQNL